MARRGLPPLLQRTADGRWRLALGDDERQLLARLAGEVEALLRDEPDDPGLRPLFPPAHPDDIAREAAYQMMLGEDLRRSRSGALEGLAAAAEDVSLDDDAVERWVQGLNAIRLVLGDRLDLRDDEEPDFPPADPRAPLWSLYEWLTWLLGRAIDDLSTDLGRP